MREKERERERWGNYLSYTEARNKKLIKRAILLLLEIRPAIRPQHKIDLKLRDR